MLTFKANMINSISNIKSNNIYYLTNKKINQSKPFRSINTSNIQLPNCSPIYFTPNFKAREEYITGHIHPDTDSVVSAIAYSYLKNVIDETAFTPVSAGKLKSETKFALDYFQVKHPKIIKNFETTIADIQTPITKKSKNVLYQDSTIKEFIDLLFTTNRVSFPVINSETSSLLGFVSQKDIAKVLLSSEKVANKSIKFDSIRKTIGATVISGENELDKVLTGRLIVGASQKSTVLNSVDKDDLVIIGDRDDVQQDVINKGVKCIIITKGGSVSNEVLKLAKEKDVIILSSPLDTYTTAKMVEQSMSVTNIMTQNPLTIDGTTTINEVTTNIHRYPYRTYPVVSDGKVTGTIEKVKILEPLDRAFILVDHTDEKQSPKGIKNREVIGIADHHNTSFVSTREDRIDEIIKKCGSTATIIAKEFKANSVEIPKHIAGILLCGILSDTDIFTSPTTENEDKVIAIELAKIAGIDDIKEFGKQLIDSREKDILEMTSYEAVKYDIKEFSSKKGKNIAIAQLFVSNPEKYLKSHKDLTEALNGYDKTKNADGTLLIVTNTAENKFSYIIPSDKFIQSANKFLQKASDDDINKKSLSDFSIKDVISKLQKYKETGELALFPNVSSRKAQVQPFVTTILSNI